MKFQRREGYLFLTVMFFVVACTAHEVVKKGEIPVVIPIEQPQPPQTISCESGKWCYDSVVKPMITSAMLLSDVSMVCKSAPADRARLWIHIVQAVSYAESNYKFASKYTENFIDDYTGKLAVSIGMLQLSISDKRKKSPYCQSLTDANIVTPNVNLQCGVEIMHWLVTHAGSKHSFLDLGAYWSVTRPANGRHQEVLKKLHELEPSC